MSSIFQLIAKDVDCKTVQIEAAVELLDSGATVPFISRYRKEVTGGLDDSQLRLVESRLSYLRELEERKTVVIAKIEELGKLTSDLRKQILQAETKHLLEDLYLPYKTKRRTKAQIAIEAGLEPLANDLLENPDLIPEQHAQTFINTELSIDNSKAALDGARAILMERFTESAELLGNLRSHLWDHGIIKASVVDNKKQEAATFKDYFDYQEPLNKIPSHRALAIFRGRKADLLEVTIELPEHLLADKKRHPCEVMIASHWDISDNNRAADKWLNEVVRWTWRVKLQIGLQSDLFNRLREQAELEAIRVFAGNLKDLLLASPAGAKTSMGLDPGLRTGVKVAVVDATGKLVNHDTIFPHPPKNQWQEAIAQLKHLCEQHQVELISIGNGTGSRETDRLVSDLQASFPALKLSKMIVNEAGASVYSASELAAREFPGVDVTLRGAISIARRLQDPLAELVKIEPKSIGVGQYQHDVSQNNLANSLDTVVEDCVNAVGVDVNTASASLLTRVAGLNKNLANKIIQFRDENGPFLNRSQLKKVPGLGSKTFEQAAGFLRITSGDNPLDASAVHPEAYPLVNTMASKHKRSVTSLIGDTEFLKHLNPTDFVNDTFGMPTIRDVMRELDKPGRDPRPDFRFANFQEGVENLSDLSAGMVLEGMVTNITNFGAFIDIGVHQDGLVHISALAYKFVKDPRDVVKTGDIVKVKVLSVDVQRKRIALSMRLDDDIQQNNDKAGSNSEFNHIHQKSRTNKHGTKTPKPAQGSMAALLLAATQEKKPNRHQRTNKLKPATNASRKLN